jgi:hypothetical protein
MSVWPTSSSASGESARISPCQYPSSPGLGSLTLSTSTPPSRAVVSANVTPVVYHQPVRKRDLRWFILGVFLVGFVVCESVLGSLGFQFVALTLVDAGACAVLLSRLGGPLRRTLWAWIGLILLLDGYFVRMYWFVYHLNQPVYINRYYAELRWVTRARILAAYPWASAGFVTFCLLASFALSLGPTKSVTQRRSREPALATWTQLVLAMFLLYMLASLLQYRVGYGVRGVANPSLPAHLGTIVTLLREVLIPGILVLALWVFDGRDRRWTFVTLFLIFTCGVVDSLLSTSRGELILFTAPVFVLWAMTGRFSSGRKTALIVVLLSALVLVPIVSAFRVQRITGGASSAGSPTSVESVTQSAFFFVDRIGTGGIEAIWYALDKKGSPSISRTIHFLQPHVFTNYYTTEIVGVQTANDYRSSGMFGAFILIGSSLLLILGSIVVVGLISGLWRGLTRLECWPVALSLASVTVSLIYADPTGALFTVVKLLIEVFTCEFVYRRLAKPVLRARTRRLAPTGVVWTEFQGGSTSFEPRTTSL